MTDMAPPNRPQSHDAARCSECGDTTPNPDCDACWDGDKRSAASGFEFKHLDGYAQPGWTLRLLIRAGKVTAAEVAHKLNIRARILRDIAPAVGMSTTGNPLDLPVVRQRNLEWTADELEIAGQTIVALASSVPRTLQDEMNTVIVEKALLALLMIRDGSGNPADEDRQWCAGVAMSALASIEEVTGGH